jgi:hypothetical protein
VKNTIRIAWSLVVFCLWAGEQTTVSADVGGGNGEPSSPYFRMSNTDENSVKSVRNTAATSRAVHFQTPSNDGIYGQHIGIAYAKPGAQLDLNSVTYSIAGTIDGTNVKRNIDFSIIQDITVLRLTNDVVILRVVIFPDISKEALF